MSTPPLAHNWAWHSFTFYLQSTFSTYKLSEEIKFDQAQQAVDNDASSCQMRSHVNLRQAADVKVGCLHALDDGRRKPVRHEEQQKARRVPHLDAVVVDHRHHCANHVGNVRYIKVKMKTAQQVVRQKPSYNLHSVRQVTLETCYSYNLLNDENNLLQLQVNTY